MIKIERTSTGSPPDSRPFSLVFVFFSRDADQHPRHMREFRRDQGPLGYLENRSDKSEPKKYRQYGRMREAPTFFCRHLQFGTDDRALAPKVRSNLSTGSSGGVNGPV